MIRFTLILFITNIFSCVYGQEVDNISSTFLPEIKSILLDCVGESIKSIDMEVHLSHDKTEKLEKVGHYKFSFINDSLIKERLYPRKVYLLLSAGQFITVKKDLTTVLKTRKTLIEKDSGAYSFKRFYYLSDSNLDTFLIDSQIHYDTALSYSEYDTKQSINGRLMLDKNSKYFSDSLIVITKKLYDYKGTLYECQTDSIFNKSINEEFSNTITSTINSSIIDCNSNEVTKSFLPYTYEKKTIFNNEKKAYQVTCTTQSNYTIMTIKYNK